MTRPDKPLTVEQLGDALERMCELESRLESRLPGRIHAVFREHPELIQIIWTQNSQEEGTEFSLSVELVELDGPDGCPQMLADPEQHPIELEEQIEALLRSIPASIMISAFGHSHRVFFNPLSFSSEYRD